MRAGSIVICLALAGPALAQAPALAPTGAPALDLPALAAQTAKRFPQPVRVGDLLGRRLLEPKEAQPVLGRVTGVNRRADGGIDLIVAAGGFLGFGAREVALPTEATALMGEYVALLGVPPEVLSKLPEARETSPVPREERIRMGITKPFH
ncbi:MAG: hypothetical protein JO048_05125 [Methylobacteriaceae bacterium]|nr:hypothetical protein [Methylobacteriaceae bacterium]